MEAPAVVLKPGTASTSHPPASPSQNPHQPAAAHAAAAAAAPAAAAGSPGAVAKKKVQIVTPAHSMKAPAPAAQPKGSPGGHATGRRAPLRCLHTPRTLPHKHVHRHSQKHPLHLA